MTPKQIEQEREAFVLYISDTKHLTVDDVRTLCNVPIVGGSLHVGEMAWLASAERKQREIDDFQVSLTALARTADRYEADRNYNAELVKERDVTVQRLEQELADERLAFENANEVIGKLRAAIETPEG